MTRGVACLSLAIAAAWGAVSHVAAETSKVSEARLTAIESDGAAIKGQLAEILVAVKR